MANQQQSQSRSTGRTGRTARTSRTPAPDPNGGAARSSYRSMPIEDFRITSEPFYLAVSYEVELFVAEIGDVHRFTDPDYGLPTDPATKQKTGKEQPGNYVYRFDPKSARLLKDLLREFVHRGGTVLMSTHTLEIAEAMCDRIAIVQGGRVAAAGTMPELRAQTSSGDVSLEELFLKLTGGLSEVELSDLFDR